MQLTSDNFVTFAAMHYRNETCLSDEEFQEDLDRYKYIKKLFSTYKRTGDLKERLILNHLVIMYNVFEPRALTEILLLKMKDSLDCLVPFLMLLGYLENKKYSIDNQDIWPYKVIMDQVIIDKLRTIIRT